MNIADSRRLASALERLGYAPTDRPEEADVIVLNTCVVRQSAEDKVYGRLGSLKPLKERRPEMVMGLMGCLVGDVLKDPSSLRRRFPWVDVLMPPSEPGPLLELLAERGLADEGRAMEAAEATRRYRLRYGLQEGDLLLPARERDARVSAYVPVVLGCSHACTYCIIPYRRGAERSRPPDEIIAESQSMVAQGVKEITLLGQIVDRYGLDLQTSDWNKPRRLADLLRRLHEIEGLQRIRFLTSHPGWMTDDLLDAAAELPKVCEHIEVPVQAGDDETLSRMRRGYTADDYRELIARIRERVPGASIATDIIVGFPGETEVQFQRTYDLLAELRLDKAHIARYSPRPQTLAARRFPDDVPPAEKERRRKTLDDLQAEIVGEINARLLGRTVKVLVEGKDRRKGRWYGRTRTDKLVFFESERDWRGRMANVRVTWAGPWSLIGEVG